MVGLCWSIHKAGLRLRLDTLYLSATLMQSALPLVQRKVLRPIRVTREYDEAEKVSMSAADTWQYICESDLKNFGIDDNQSQRDCITD